MNTADTLQILTGQIVAPCLIKNAYYKDSGQRPFQPLMSGLPLPLDTQGRLDGITFDHCDFHPCCPDVRKLGATVIGPYYP